MTKKYKIIPANEEEETPEHLEITTIEERKNRVTKEQLLKKKAEIEEQLAEFK